MHALELIPGFSVFCLYRHVKLLLVTILLFVLLAAYLLHEMLFDHSLICLCSYLLQTMFVSTKRRELLQVHRGFYQVKFFVQWSLLQPLYWLKKKKLGCCCSWDDYGLNIKSITSINLRCKPCRYLDIMMQFVLARQYGCMDLINFLSRYDVILSDS